MPGLFKRLKGLFFALVGLGLGLGGLPAGGAALAGVVVSGVTARAPIIEGRPGVAYFTVKNTGPGADRLLGVTSPGIGRIELHESMMVGDMMTMRPLDAVDIPAGAEVIFKPGAYHAMLFDIDRAALAGASLPLVFRFEKAGKITVEATLARAGSKKPHHP